MGLGGYNISDRVSLRESDDLSLVGLEGTVCAVEQREVSERRVEVWLSVELDGYGTHCQRAEVWSKVLE